MKYVVLILFILTSSYSYAQRKSYDYYQETYFSTLSIKYSTLALFEFDQAVAFALEYRFSSRLGVQVEYGYIFNSLSYTTRQRKLMSSIGHRVGAEIRNYYGPEDNTTNSYIGVQLSYKYVRKEFEKWDDKGPYLVAEKIDLKKYNYTAAFIIGIQRHPTRVGFDLNCGIGFKYKEVNYSPNPNQEDQVSYTTGYGEFLTGVYPQITASFKLCYRIY